MVNEWNAKPERKMNMFFINHEDSYLREAAEFEDFMGIFAGFVIINLNHEIKKRNSQSRGIYRGAALPACNSRGKKSYSTFVLVIFHNFSESA